VLIYNFIELLINKSNAHWWTARVAGGFIKNQ
jgi:hypothetical protein